MTTYRFTYPGGPVNAEALIADPRREQLWVVSKEDGVGAMYALPSPMSDSRTPMTAERVGAARAQVTDAAMAPNGKRFVVRDYLSAEVFTGKPPGEPEARFGLPLQLQGEAVTWTADGRSLLVASERSGNLIRVDVPASALGTDGGVAGGAAQGGRVRHLPLRPDRDRGPDRAGRRAPRAALGQAPAPAQLTTG